MATASDYIRLARPHQYVKNGFIFLPLFFGLKYSDASAVLRTCAAFGIFCLLASGVYIFNDFRDREADGMHPRKKDRPLASGRVKPGPALALACVCAAVGLGEGAFLGTGFLAIAGGYLVLNLAYSLGLKHAPIIDINCISLGFVLRLYAGSRAALVPLSHWIILMTFLLALFLALGKRRDELPLAEENGNATRRSLDGYNHEMVTAAMVMMGAVTIVSYILYTVSPDVTAYFKSDSVFLTTFWVILGILRYLQDVFVRNLGGSPSRVVLRDVFLQITILGWLASFGVIMYLAGP